MRRAGWALLVLGLIAVVMYRWSRGEPPEVVRPDGSTAAPRNGVVGPSPVASQGGGIPDAALALIDAGTLPATLSGEVFDDGAGVAGAQITAEFRADESPNDCENTATGRSVAGGGFELGALCPGLYDLTASREGRAATEVIRLAPGAKGHVRIELSSLARLWVNVQTAPKAPVADAKVTVQDKTTGFVAEASTDEEGVAFFEPLRARVHELRVSSDGALQGYIPDSALVPGDNVVTVTMRRGTFQLGTMADPQGAPVDGVTVSLFRAGKRGDLGTFWAKGETADGGSFRIGPVEAGAYWATTNDSSWLATRDRAVLPGPPLRIAMHRGPPVDGEVLDADGVRVERCKVLAYAPPQIDTMTYCDAGTFLFPSLRAGPLALIGAVFQSDGGFADLGSAHVVVPANGLHITIQIADHEGTISGVCSKKGGGLKAVADSSVTHYKWSGFQSLSKDVRPELHAARCTPEFTLKGLLPGRYALECDDIYTFARTGETEVKVACAPEGSLRFRVVDETRKPIERFGFTPDELEDHPGGLYVTAESGPGDFSLTIYAQGFLPFQRRIAIAPDKPLDLGDLAISRTGVAISGRVVSAADAAPISEASVGVAVAMGAAMFGTKTVEDGSFIISDAPRNPAALEITHREYLTQIVPLAEGQTAVEVKLTRGAVIWGSVITHDGAMPEGLTVHGHCGTKTAETWISEGRYELGPLEPCAAWQLRIEGGAEAMSSGFDLASVEASTPTFHRFDFVERSSGVSFEVEVVDSRGVPVQSSVYGVDAALRAPGTLAALDAFLKTVGVRADGAQAPYSFERVKPAPWRLIVWPVKDHPSVFEQPLTVTPGMPSLITVTLPDGLKPMPP